MTTSHTTHYSNSTLRHIIYYLHNKGTMDKLPAHTMRIARYYVPEKRITYYIGDKIKVTRIGITEAQARALIKLQADGPREMVQALEVVYTTD